MDGVLFKGSRYKPRGAIGQALGVNSQDKGAEGKEVRNENIGRELKRGTETTSISQILKIKNR